MHYGSKSRDWGKFKRSLNGICAVPKVVNVQTSMIYSHVLMFFYFTFKTVFFFLFFTTDWRRRQQRKKMPSRFLTLWSMLSKPASQQQSPPKKKNKKDTQTPQVCNLPFFAFIFTRKKKDSLLCVSYVPLKKKKKGIASSVSQRVFITSTLFYYARDYRVVHTVNIIYFSKFHCLRTHVHIRSFNCCAVCPPLRLRI